MADQHGCGFDACCGRRSGTARLIDPRMPELARSLTLFRHVQALTGGPVARLDQVGSYAVPSRRGEAFAVPPDPDPGSGSGSGPGPGSGSIALRLDADGVTSAVVTRDAEDAVAIRLLDRYGRAVHEGRLLSEGDRLLAGLAATVEVGSGTGAPPSPPAPTWENGDQLAQLDAILADGGSARRAAMTRYGGEHHEVDPAVLPTLLDHVRSVGLPLGVAVFAPSAMQACAGRVHVTDRTAGGRVYAAVANASLELDLPAVHSCHLVRSPAAHGPTSALELDDEDGDCVAVLTQFGIVGEQVHGAWERLTASLP